MPLSEEELRMLEQMERALVEEDPKFASTLRGTEMRRASRRRAIVAGLVFGVGVVLLMTGAVASQPVIGVLGFVIMLGSAMLALTSLRGRAQPVAQEPRESRFEGLGVVDGGRRDRGRSRRPHADTGFMDRMEERWRRRREQGY